MPALLHEYWDNGGDGDEFSPVTERNDQMRASLSPNARRAFTVRATSWFEALQMRNERLGYGVFIPPEGIEDQVYTCEEVAQQDAYLRTRELG